MELLDQIRWRNLTHAYGSAEDVPDLLRSLRTALPENSHDENSPLWCLFGNIWHQGTVYEATSYAVPFLLELAEDLQTPDRIGILQLLAAIAEGKSSEPEWATKAHNAVSAGLNRLVRITNENSDVGLAATHVLAQLPELVAVIGPILRGRLNAETSDSRRAGIILLLGQVKDRSEESLSALSEAAQSANSAMRRAAALSVARLMPIQLPQGVREAIIYALTTDEPWDVWDLPWDAGSEVDVLSVNLHSCLDGDDLNLVANTLITALESGSASAQQVTILVYLIFPRAKHGRTKQLTANDLSSLQRRAIVAMVNAMESGKRIFYGPFEFWGLPDTMREWRNLAAGRQPIIVDMSLPLLAEPGIPRRSLRTDKLTLGQRILHRHFGLGIVTSIVVTGASTQLTVSFDEEGVKTLRLTNRETRQ